MFVSTGNNFGAGQIRFKSYQAENYLVLNANFSFLTGNPDYQAAEVLEISVPTMRIDRSVEVGVFVGFRDRRQSYGSGTCYDGCTLARSWIKDSNTICIEKLACMSGKEKLYIYIAALYPQLNQGLSDGKQTKNSISLTPLPECCPFNSKSMFVVKEHWVMLLLILGNVPGAISSSPWASAIENLPVDIQGVLPFCGGSQQYNGEFNGLSEITIKEGRFTSRYRCMVQDGSFAFAFLVRGDNEGEVVDEWPLLPEDERIRYIFDREKQGEWVQPGQFSFELAQGLLLLSFQGWFGSNGPGNGNQFEVETLHPLFPQGRSGVVGRTKDGNRLAIYDIFCETSMNPNYGRVIPACSAPKDTLIEVFDTNIYTYNPY